MNEKLRTMERIPHVEDDPDDVSILQKAVKMAGAAITLPAAGGIQAAIDESRGAGTFADGLGTLEVKAKAIKDSWLTHNRPPQAIAESPMEGVVSLVNVTMESSHPRAAIHVYE